MKQHIFPTRKKLESMTNEELISSLEKLALDINHRLGPHQISWDDYWAEVSLIIKELKKLGHDLWSHGSDGDGKHMWGWDYMRLKKAGCLQIQFDFNDLTQTFWRHINPQLGPGLTENEGF